MVASDWHIEERVAPNTVSGLNTFDLAIGKKRATAFFQRGLRLIKLLQQDVKIDTIVLALLGDFITNDIYDAENADAFRVEGPNAEGHVWVDCSSPQCRRGIVVELPLSELGQPSPGWVIRNFHADVFNTPVFLQNVAQFVVEGLLYRTTTATDIWDGLALVGTCRQGRVNVDFVNNSANNGPARAGESCGIWGVVNYAALNDVDITARGGALFQVVRLQSGARYDNVHDCRATNLIAGGVVVKNLSGYASPPDMVLRDNY